MAYCRNCGIELASGAKFCQNCGCSTGSEQNTYGQRKQEYAGKLYKCPSCGEVLKSFEINCPSCGHELRGTQASSAVKEFALKLEAIESKREYEKPRGIFAANEALLRISKTDQQKISLIKNFAVPNSKEDMLEFMILATSNMNMGTYDSTNSTISKGEKELNAAWFAKARQVYEKAQRSYSADDVFLEIQKLYDRCNADIRKAKKKSFLKWTLIVGWIPLALIVLIVGLTMDAKQEQKRLESLPLEVQEALDAGEYKHALRIADSIDYQGGDAAEERKWDIEREYWVEKVIEVAAENGVELEYIPTADVDKTNDNPDDDSSSGGFVEGFNDALEPGLDEMQSNIDEFKDIVNDIEWSNRKDESMVTEQRVEADVSQPYTTGERDQDGFAYAAFVDGYEKADFAAYNSNASENGLGGSKIYLECTLDKTEILEADGTVSIIGYVTDDGGNPWLVHLHVVPIVAETHFDAVVGESIVLRGVYSGFSGTKQMPAIVLDELLIKESGTTYYGMQKLLD